MKKASIIFLFSLFSFLSFSANAQSNCTFTLNPTNLVVPHTGGNYSVGITTQEGCAWSAQFTTGLTTRPMPLTFTSPTSGTGSGKIDFTIGENLTTTAGYREGTITIGGKTVVINQDRNCGELFVNPLSIDVPIDGAALVGFNFSPSAALCGLITQINVPWITTSASGGNYSGGNFSVAPNTGAPRTGTVTILYKSSNFDFIQKTATFTVNQAGQQNCTYSINPTSIQAGAGAGDTGFNITTETGCNWTASSNAGWIIVLTPSGTGSGRVNYSIQANTGTTPRIGTITVQGQTFTINQDAFAAPVEIITGGGRVMSADNKPIRGALVTFTNSTTGEAQTVVTNQFGYFHLRIQRSHPYGVLISHKRYKFSGIRLVTYNTGALIQIFTADSVQQ